MRLLNAGFQKKTAIFIIMAMALPALCGAVDIQLPGINLRYGKLERSRDVTKIFETPRIIENHKYYYNGWGSVPYAIIAINSKYKLRKGLWKAVEPTVPLLRSWVHQMDMIYGYAPHGFRILDHKGNPVGDVVFKQTMDDHRYRRRQSDRGLCARGPGFSRRQIKKVYNP